MKWSIVVSVVVCTWAGSLLATPVELAEAISVAQTWMARRGRLCQPVSGRTYIAQNGVNRFHVVGMSGGGFVALAANDELEPVLAFSDGANVSCEPGSPLHALLSKHVQEDRPSVVDVLSKSADSSEGLLAWSSLDGSDRVGAGAAWRVLKKASGGNVLSSGASTSSTTIGVSSLSDVRRSPLVKSSWGQSQTTGWGYNCFNLYTPYGYPCGCAATAMAQLMRYHAYPSSKVASVTKTCRINGTKYLIETFGGIYDWEDMPLDPSWTMSETKLRAIGKLTVDCGISVNMSYTSGGSGADAAKVPSALRTVFQCKQVKSGTPGLSALKKILMANLDYAKPVILAISGIRLIVVTRSSRTVMDMMRVAISTPTSTWAGMERRTSGTASRSSRQTASDSQSSTMRSTTSSPKALETSCLDVSWTRRACPLRAPLSPSVPRRLSRTPMESSPCEPPSSRGH